MQNLSPQETAKARRIRVAGAALVIALQMQVTIAAGNCFAQRTAKGAHSPKGDAQSQAFLGPTPVSAAAAQRAGQQKVDRLFTSMGIHMSNQLPINFPVPAYPSNVTKTFFSSTIRKPLSATAMILTNDPTERVFQFYCAAATKAGFKTFVHKPKEVPNKKGKVDRLYTVRALKDKQELKIACLPDNKTRGTKVSMLWSLTH